MVRRRAPDTGRRPAAPHTGPALLLALAFGLLFTQLSGALAGGGSLADPPSESALMQTQSNPHTDYLNNPDACARCHRVHTGANAKLIFSAASGNAFCYVCHDGTGASAAPPVSTHSNADYSGGAEQTFTLLCVQCHNPHGSPNNLAGIRDYVVVVPGTNPVTSGPVLFTATTGLNSYDDGSSDPASRICVTCHNDPNNPGYPMLNHVGGTNHQGGNNFAGLDCTTCHPHSADNDRYTDDGFMPGGGCTGCHSFPQDNGDGVPVGGRRAIVPEFSNTSHHVTTAVEDADCQVCHDTSNHQAGQVELLDVDTGATIVYSALTDLEPFCLACHDSDGALGAAPFSDGLMPPVVDPALWNSGSHQGAGSASCGDCHDNGHGSIKVSLLAPWDATAGGGDDPLNEEEGFCYRCHDGGVAGTDIQAQFASISRHNLTTTDQGDGSKVECRNCHNPHTVSPAQKVIDPDGGALWSGTATAFCQVCHDGAPPAGVTFAGGGPGSPISTHSNQDFAGVEGNFIVECHQCHQPHGTGNLNLIRPLVFVTTSPEVLNGPVSFLAYTGVHSYDDGAGLEVSRICVVCHQDTNNPGYPMVSHTGGSTHNGGLDFTGKDCRTCHLHDLDSDSTTLDGFMIDPSCVGCHQIPLGPRRQIAGPGGDFELASHHVSGTVQDEDCELCHEMTQHQAGTVRLFDVDTGGVIPYTGGAIPDAFCLACHDADGAAGNTTPFSDGLPVPNASLNWAASSHAVTLGCSDCHDNGHGSNKQGLLGNWNAVPDGDPDDPLVQEERFCYQCHDGGVAATNIQGEFNRSSHHDVALTDQNGNGARVECINCHNPHMDNAANQNASPDDWYQQWTGRRVDFCLACHDGSPPVVTGGPPPAVSLPGAWSGTGYDKSAFPGSTHDSTLSAWGCSHCHDEHGSDFISTLLDNYVITDFNPYSYGDGSYSLCWTCHSEAQIVRDAGGNKAVNAFDDRHDKHVRGEESTCSHCHDPHSPYDPGEEGLINLLFGVTQMDVTILTGYDQSTVFVINNNTGSCYLGCHGKDHNPKDYDRSGNLPSSTTCTACHPGGPPPPSLSPHSEPPVGQPPVPTPTPKP